MLPASTVQAFPNPSRSDGAANRATGSQATDREMVLRRALHSSAFPNPVPAYLGNLPSTHIVSQAAIQTMAGELLAFNHDMSEFDGIDANIPISVVFGTRDRVINPRWHCDWIRSKHPCVEIRMLDGVGHMPHHAYPETCRQLLADFIARAVEAAQESTVSHAA
jgi:pimeloyl-ACP methyl ester carboxylesterase